MITVAEASTIILSNLFTAAKEFISIEVAPGRILAENIFADRHFPPFSRATMDGIAIEAASVRKGVRSFPIEGVQAAGQPRLTLSNQNHCIEIMTGAMIPEGTNTVVRYEDLEISQEMAVIKINSINEGDNIHFQGMDAKQNDVLIECRTKLSAAEIALLASVGKADVEVFSSPTIAIVSTGDELVSIDEQPLPHQIRTSNAYALQAALTETGIPSTRFHIKDNETILKTELSKLVESFDVILLSGGVSRGKFDFVPTVLEGLGIKKLFHQVSQKPGKPMWFGRSSEAFVFALPGNPVSTFMCFHRYVKPWLLKSLNTPSHVNKAILAEDYIFKPALTYFLQVKIKNEEGKLMAYPITGGGSGDFANLKEVNGFLELPAEKSEFKAGEVFPLISFN